MPRRISYLTAHASSVGSFYAGVVIGISSRRVRQKWRTGGVRHRVCQKWRTLSWGTPKALATSAHARWANHPNQVRGFQDGGRMRLSARG
jgi:hypothetical protein